MSDESRGEVGEGSVQRDEEKLSKRTNVYEIISGHPKQTSLRLVECVIPPFNLAD